MSEENESEETVPQQADGEQPNEFARPDEVTAKMPSLKKKGLLARDAKRHQGRGDEEE